MTGQRFGQLTVLRRDENDYITPSGERKVQWICQCDCGAIKSIVAGSLLNGRTQSCGKHKEAWNKGKIITEAPHYILHDDYVSGILSSGVEFIFDLDDYNLVTQYNWFISPNGYIKTGATIGTLRFLHRLILNASKDEYVDHINHNPLDNRKCNLRICTCSQNGANNKQSQSIYRGIHYDNRSNKWFAVVVVCGKNIYSNYYSSLDDAIAARRKLEDKYFGEFSYYNSKQIAEKNGVII